jgi:hypothetical protein
MADDHARCSAGTDYEHGRLYVYDATSQTFDPAEGANEPARLLKAAHEAFMAMCAHRDSPDNEALQDAIDALGLACAHTTTEPQAALDRKTIANAVEPIILRRLHEKKVEGYTLPMSWELADAIVALTRPQGK